ncbi:MAG: LysR family transcriptional regulator [Rhodanobacter sp.]
MQQTNHLANLYLLVQVVDAGGLSAAARQLGMTRSMVSRRIIELERRLGVRLLHRHARQFAITPAGERVYRHALVMCDAALAATAAGRTALETESGLVRIGVDPLLLPLVGELLVEFSTRHPLTRVVLSGDNVTALLKHRLDVVLSVGDLPSESAQLSADLLGGMRRVVVASPDLLQRLEHPRHPHQLDERHCLAYAPRPWELRGASVSHRDPRLTSDQLPTLLAMACAGAGVAQLPMYLCHEQLAGGRLRMIFEAFEARPLPLHALSWSGNVGGQASRDFIAFARQHLAGLATHGIIPGA